MYQTLIVLDDVLQNAEELRQTALGLDYADKTERDYFPGRNSAHSVRVPALDELAQRLTGEALVPGTEMHGKFRLASAQDTARGGVHVDQCNWSGLFFLSQDSDCVGGTDFFRHRETNSEHAPYTQAHLDQWGYKSYKDFVDRVATPQAKDFDKWDRVMTIPMRFNRLILFRPWLWHNAGPGFGSVPEDSRLVYLMFLNNARPG